MPEQGIVIPTRYQFKNLTGERFNRLLVVKFLGKRTRGRRSIMTWRCQCDCGETVEVFRDALTSGHVQSCGCLQRESRTKHGYSPRHGGNYRREYRVWIAMRERCSNVAASVYYRYGGRGITVCKRWDNFALFFQDMGPRPTPKHEIERRDNDGNYEPDNCYWATRDEQMRNTSRTRRITFNGVTMCVKDWADHLKINMGTLRRRLDLGWTVKRAFGEPINEKFRQRRYAKRVAG